MPTPTPEMYEFAKEACRVHALNQAGLSTRDDLDRLELLGALAKHTQLEANSRDELERG